MRLDDAFDLLRSAHETLVGLGKAADSLEPLYPLATLPLFLGPLADAEARAGEALAYARTVQSNYHELNILCALAGVALARGDDARFDALLTEGTAGTGDNYWLALLAVAQAEIAGDVAAALALLPEPERSGGFPTYLAHVHGGRARVHFRAGDEAGARRELAVWREACAAISGGYAVTHNMLLAISEAADCLPALADDALVRDVYAQLVAMAPIRFAPWSARGIDAIRGALALHLGDVDAAAQHFQIGLTWSEGEGLSVEQGRCLEGLAQVALRRGQQRDALSLLERAVALFEQPGAHLHSRDAQAMAERLRAAAQAAPSSKRVPSATPGGLSAREVEVLRLLTAGQTNQEIAAALVLSPGTVARHTANIYAKIGTRGRADAVAYALRHGLDDMSPV